MSGPSFLKKALSDDWTLYQEVGLYLLKIVIVSDIFGVTPHLKMVAQSLSSQYEIIDPYNGQMVEFKSESEAYDHFSRLCGLTAYTDSVRESISSCNEKIYLLGFSVGASAVWNSLESDRASMISKAVCFYGSRIRDNKTLKPCCDTTLIFPKKERSFSVPELSRFLAGTPNVRCIDTELYHGFMNPLSDNFNRSGYLAYIDWLKRNFDLL